jgi:TRAP-type C4-dicarboxylate transport system permease small subunit
MIDGFEARWRRLEVAAVGTLVTLALGIFLYGSAMRTFAPALAIDWAEEVTIYLIVWATLLSGGSLAAEREHISAQIATHLLTPRARAYLTFAIELIVLAFCGLMAWLGVQAVMFANALDERSASTLQAPQAFVLYLALPVGMTLIVLRMILLLRRRPSIDG